MSRLSVLMPVFNEQATLPEVVRRVAASPVSVRLEIIAVDDGSTDDSPNTLARLAEEYPVLKVVHNDRNRGKGAAVRKAIEHMTGDVAVIQDADLEYDPNDFPKLMEPILAGRADAVFGSRFADAPRAVRRCWHTRVNRFLTALSNRFTGLSLTDMETCYKMVRADVLRGLPLKSRTFTLEPELTCRLAQAGARIEEVPISYHRRTRREGKKIGSVDGLKAISAIVRYGFFGRRSRNVGQRSG